MDRGALDALVAPFAKPAPRVPHHCEAAKVFLRHPLHGLAVKKLAKERWDQNPGAKGGYLAFEVQIARDEWSKATQEVRDEVLAEREKQFEEKKAGYEECDKDEKAESAEDDVFL